MKTRSFFSSVCAYLCSFLLMGCGEMTDMEINNPEFIKGVVVDGPWDVTVYQSETAKAHIDYRDSYNITAEVRNDGYLYLKAKKHLNSNWRKDLKAVIEIPYIEYIKASGACDISFNGKFEGKICNVDMDNASDVKHFEYYGDTISLNIDDASGCSMQGEANHVKISGKGASDTHMFNLTTETLDINLSGSSDAEVTVNKRITGKISGSATLKYRGNADCLELKKSGSADIIKKN